MRGVGNGDHEIAVGGSLEREAPAQLSPDLVHGRPADPGVGPSQVHELEDAQRAPLGQPEPRRDHAALVDPHQLAWLDVAEERRTHDVERAGLGGDAEAVREPADREGPQAVRVASREDAAFVHHHERERTLERGKDIDQRGLEVLRGVPGEDGRDQVGVRRGGACGPYPPGELERVHEVSVVPERQGPLPVGLERRLGVFPRGRARRGVTVVADPQVAAERRERRLVEDLGDEPELLEDQDVLAVGDGHPGRLLAAMLLREQREVGQPSDVIAGCPHGEDAALLLGTLGTHPTRC
jgi:hypothetical protein